MAAAVSSAIVNMSGHLQSQLSRSLERILEDAYLSGELRLSGRKLKDFPKTGKYDLTDTVIADLSKNRFGELPDELTSYLYLERLLLGHNAIRHVPDAVGSLQSLIYLDISFNQLSELPRELCLLPLEVLIVANNHLTLLPKEIGKMLSLAELDAGCNRIAQLPIAIGDLSNLRSLNLRNNQLTLLPLQVTYLHLEMLDVSCNCISSLPLELRLMASLVILKLDHNPLVSPPTIVCMRGRVHIFRYLENMANKDSVSHRRHDDIRRSGKHSGSYGGFISPSTGNALTDSLRARSRHTVDSGYNTCDGEKRWSNDGVPEDSCPLYPGGIHQGALTTFSGNGISGGSGRSTPSTPSTLSPGSANLSRTHSLNSDGRITPQNNGLRISPDGNLTNGDDKSKSVNHQQTYRQYKEALRQQRQQDIYRPREQSSPSEQEPIAHSHHSPVHLQKHSQSTPHSPIANGHYVSALPSLNYLRNVSSNPSIATTVSTVSNPLINGSPPIHSTPKRSQSPLVPCNNFNCSTAVNTADSIPTKHFGLNEETPNRRPVQKVVPSRNVNTSNKSYTSPTLPSQSNIGNVLSVNPRLSGSPIEQPKFSQNHQEGGYIKPLSPTKSPSVAAQGGIPPNSIHYVRRDQPVAMVNGTEQGPKLLTTTVSYLKGTSPKPPGTSGRLTWNKDVPPDKLSFTMKREFDKAKEESDLIHQLRNIIESRLKMTLPDDIAPVLADGVVLCHLANHVRPRAVASVHVPSPAQPKLTMARCRRNVDNFLEACRKIGVEEGAICRPDDALQCQDCTDREKRRRLVAVARTVAALLGSPDCITTTHADSAFNNHREDQEDGEYCDRSFTEYEHSSVFYSDDLSSIETVRAINLDAQHGNEFFISEDGENAYNSSDSYQDTVYFQPKQVSRSRYDEDRLVSNFNSYITEVTLTESDFENSNAVLEDDPGFQNNNQRPMALNEKYENNEIHGRKRSTSSFVNEHNKVNKVMPIVQDRYLERSSPCCSFDSNQSFTIAKRIKHFNGRAGMSLQIKDNLNSNLTQDINAAAQQNSALVTCLCLGTFCLSVILLYLFPLP